MSCLNAVLWTMLDHSSCPKIQLQPSHSETFPNTLLLLLFVVSLFLNYCHRIVVFMLLTMVFQQFLRQDDVTKSADAK